MSRRTLIYLGILALLGVLTFLRQSVPQGPAPIAFTIPALQGEDITKVSLTWDKGAVTLLRAEPGEGGEWLVEGLDYPADPTTLKALLKLFEDPAPMDFEVSDKPDDQSTYELTEAQALRLEVFGIGDSPEVALFVGKNGPMGTQFLRPVGSSQIYRAKFGNAGRFKKSPEDWRDNRVLFVDSEDIRSLEISGLKGEFSFKKSGEEWQVAQPAGLKADQSLISSMPRSLGTLRSTEILPEPPPVGSFDEPYLTVTLGLEGAGAPLVLTIGREAGDNQRYAKRSSDGQGFLVRTASLNALTKGAGDLRDKSLLRFEPASLETLSLQEGPRRVVVKASEKPGEWRVLEPANAAIFPQTMNPVVTTLSRLRVASFKDDALPEDVGLEEGGFVVEVSLKGGETHRLKVGSEADGGQYYAQVDEGEVVTIFAASVKTLRQLLPAS